MALTTQEYQTLILAEVGDYGVVSQYIQMLWEKHEGRTPLNLQYLFVKRDAIYMLMGAVWADVNQSLPSRARLELQNKFENLRGMLQEIMVEINAWSAGGTAPVVGELEATYPVPGLSGFPDPNDPYYRGDPTAVQLGWWYSRSRTW